MAYWDNVSLLHHMLKLFLSFHCTRLLSDSLFRSTSPGISSNEHKYHRKPKAAALLSLGGSLRRFMPCYCHWILHCGPLGQYIFFFCLFCFPILQYDQSPLWLWQENVKVHMNFLPLWIEMIVIGRHFWSPWKSTILPGFETSLPVMPG